MPDCSIMNGVTERGFAGLRQTNCKRKRNKNNNLIFN